MMGFANVKQIIIYDEELLNKIIALQSMENIVADSLFPVQALSTFKLLLFKMNTQGCGYQVVPRINEVKDFVNINERF